HDADCAVTLGQFFAVRAKYDEQYVEDGRVGDQSGMDYYLSLGGVDVIVAPDDVGDGHVPVVHHHTEVVGGRPVGPGNDQIVQFAVVEGDGALDHVVPGGDTVLRVAEANHGFAVGRNGRQGLARFRTPGAVVAGLETGGTRLLAHGLDLLGAAVAVVGRAFVQHALNDLAIAVHALHLIEGAFIRCQFEPGHAIQNGLDGFRGGAFQVGIFNAQHESAAMMAGEGPGKQRSARATQV